MPTLTYRRAGVDIQAAEAWLGRMGPAIRSTHGPDVLDDLGQFAGLFRFPSRRYRDPVLVASADGVGTKLKVAALVGAHEAIGVDVVAMNVNDVLVYGAQPLFFLDYLAVGRVQPRLMSQLLGGIVNGCRQSGCALLGGETAEMPGVYARGDYDLAGFCVGVASRRALIDSSRVRAGDAVIGLASSGVHANGFSLVRKALAPGSLRRMARQLLAPTRIYVRPVLRLLERVPVRAIVHVTGGGLARRLPALVAKQPRLAVRVASRRWRPPPVFAAIQREGRLERAQMRATFNMGIGMALAVRAPDVPRALAILRRAGTPAWHIGGIEARGRGTALRIEDEE